jgi:hypothetical protein
MRSPMLLLFVAVLALSTAPAYGGEFTLTLDPTQEIYPPGIDPVTCEVTGTAPCVQFLGTLTDNDTDGSLLAITGISVIFTGSDGDYFTLDQNVFGNDVPGILEGDTDGFVASNRYSGTIFGIDINSAPQGVYTETVEISACNLSNDVNCESGDADPGAFTEDEQFTIVVTPEPAAASLLLEGLAALAVWHGLKCKRRASESLL